MKDFEMGKSVLSKGTPIDSLSFHYLQAIL